jgi:hypothetical protein
MPAVASCAVPDANTTAVMPAPQCANPAPNPLSAAAAAPLAPQGDVSHDGSDDFEALDPQSPTGLGSVDLHSYSSAPFSLHSVTPPRHVMQALAAEMAGRLHM